MIDRRNSKIYDFDIESLNLNVDQILAMDVRALQSELRKGSFTSLDLVKIFGDRCQRIGRALNLSTEENFTQAMEMAKELDQQRDKAREEGGAEALEELS